MLKFWWWQGRKMKISEVEDRFSMGVRFQDEIGSHLIKMYLV